MTTQEFLEYNLFSYNNFSITPGALIAAVLLFLVLKFALYLIRVFLVNVFKKKQFEAARADAFMVVARYFIWVIYFLIVLMLFGLDITWLVAGSTALLVGIGLGLQNVFNDFVSGLIILFEGTVDPGDIITVDGMVCKVKKIGIRTSQVITQNNITILVPNHKLTDDNVINWSHMHEAPRYHVSVGVAYGSDTELVSKILLESVVEHPRVSKKEQPFVRFTNFGNSSLDFEVFFWSEEIFLIEDILSDIRLAIDKKFRASGIVIPFPQRDLHIKSSDLQSLK